MDHFCLPLLFNGFQQIGSYFPHAALESADLEWFIASRGALLQLPEDIAATTFRVGNAEIEAGCRWTRFCTLKNRLLACRIIAWLFSDGF